MTPQRIKPSRVEVEIRNRIRLAVWAYAYEIMGESLVDDATFDRVALEIDLSIDTGNAVMDSWYRAHYLPHTGQWVQRHPNHAYLRSKAELLIEYRDAPVEVITRPAKPKQLSLF